MDVVYVIVNTIGCSACSVVYYKQVVHIPGIKKYGFGIK